MSHHHMAPHIMWCLACASNSCVLPMYMHMFPAGVDLNRIWSSPSPKLHPTIYATRDMITRLSQARPILLCMDLHGHSKKMNVSWYHITRVPMMHVIICVLFVGVHAYMNSVWSHAYASYYIRPSSMDVIILHLSLIHPIHVVWWNVYFHVLCVKMEWIIFHLR